MIDIIVFIGTQLPINGINVRYKAKYFSTKTVQKLGERNLTGERSSLI